MKGKHDVSPCTTAASIPNQTSMSTQETGPKRIEGIMKLKRKVGRPLKKKTLLKMAKLMSTVQKEDANDKSKQYDWAEEKGTSVQQEVTSREHKKVIKETQTGFPHLRRSSRTAKPVEVMDFTPDPAQHISPSSEHTEPSLRKDDSTGSLSTASPTSMCRAEAVPRCDVPGLHKGKTQRQTSAKKSRKIPKKKITCDDSNPPDIPAQTVPEIQPADDCAQTTAKAKRRMIDREANKKNKQGISAFEPTFSTVPGKDMKADHDKGISTPTAITPLNSQQQKSLKRTKYQKGRKARGISALNTTEQLGVCGSLPESPLLQSPVECGSENPTEAKNQRDRKSPQQSDFHPPEKKMNAKCVTTKAKEAKKGKVPSKRLVEETNRVISSTADICLGEMPVCSSQLVHGSKLTNKNSCHSIKHPNEKLNRNSPPIEAEPQTQKPSRKKLKDADSSPNLKAGRKPETKSQKKNTVKKNLMTKTNNLNVSDALSHPTADENIPLLPVLNPTMAEKPKHNMPSLPTSAVSHPVPASLPAPSQKGQLAEPVTAQRLKSKQLLKVMSPKKREDQTSEPKLLNGLNVSNDKDPVNCSEMDSTLNEMENSLKKKRMSKSSIGKTDDNMPSTFPKALVHGIVTENKLAPVPVNVKQEKSTLSPSDKMLPLLSSAASTDEGDLTESVSPPGVKRPPQQKGKLSKRKCSPSRKKSKVQNRNNLSKAIEPLESAKAPIDKVFTPKAVTVAHAVASSVEEGNKLVSLNHCTSPSGRNAKDIDSSIESVAKPDNSLCKSTYAPNESKSSIQSETVTSNITDVSRDIKIQKVRQQTSGSQGESETSEAVDENKEVVNSQSAAHTTSLHSNAKLRKPTTCRFCGCTFQQTSAYSLHKCTHTGKKPYGCLKCGKRFAQFSKLRLHANVHRRPDPVRCLCCSQTFPDKAELIVHFKIHMKETENVNLMENRGQAREIQAQIPANDTVSPVPLKTSTSLRPHSSFNDALEIRTSPTNVLVKPYICSICGLKFDKYSSYCIHGRTHRHSHPYACSICGEGFNQLRKLKVHSKTHSGEMASSVPHCEDPSCGLSDLHAHPTSKARSETTDEAFASTVDGFLVKQGVDGQINTPMFFKCQICKQLHRHWCQYVLHLQTHTKVYVCLCDVCGQQYNQVSKTSIHCKVCCKKSGEERACSASLSEVLKEPTSSQNLTLRHPPETLPGDHQEQSSLPSSSEMSCGSGHQRRQTARTLSSSLVNAPRRRYTCAQCGKSFSQWNKLWVHHKIHRQKGKRFPCTQCKLEFYYFESYRDHMREHASLCPFVCPLCPEAFVTGKDLTAHLREHLDPSECLKCETCGKRFKSFQSLERHNRLHKGANSNHCLLCNVLFCSTSALQDHLNTHKSLLRTPLPIGPVEPFLYPYHCRKCKARFTSTDLLLAHQVCHLNASSEAIRSPPQTVATFHQSKTPSKGLTCAKALPVSVPPPKKTRHVPKKSNLFRYPHPDRLYVVPVLSSEPPVVISDSDDTQVTVTTLLTLSSSINIQSRAMHKGHANGFTEVPTSQPAQPTSKSTTVFLNGVDAKLRRQATTPPSPASSGHLRRDLVTNVPSRVQTAFRDEDADDEYEEDDLVDVTVATAIPEEPECDEFRCVVCQANFTVVSDLHDHYVHHARGVI